MEFHRMMGPPAILLVSVLIWLGVLVITAYVSLLRLLIGRERWQAYAPFFWILLFTAMFPLRAYLPLCSTITPCGDGFLRIHQRGSWAWNWARDCSCGSQASQRSRGAAN
jgi:hypothetical protein